MKVGLNLPTTYRVDQELLRQIADLGFDHVRVDVPPEGDLHAFVHDYVNAPVSPLFLLHDIARAEPLLDVALPQGSFWFALQVFNEPPGMDPVDLPTYTQGILAVHHDARARGFEGDFLMGGLGNPSAENRMWLRKALESMPADVVVDEHRYAYRTQDKWERPWPPYTSRELETEDLKRIASGRRVSYTEIGWHTAKETIGHPLFGGHTTQLTDEQARDNLVKDLELYSSLGVDRVTIYQLNDGAGTTFLDTYGIRSVDGAWKPQAQAVQIWRSLHGSE